MSSSMNGLNKRILITTAALVLLLPGAAFAQEGSPLIPAEPATDGEPLPSGLSAEAYRAITSHIELDLYGVKPTADDIPAGSALTGANPAQAYTTRFTPHGIFLRPRGTEAELGLTLTGWGYGTALDPVAPVLPRAQGQRAEYARGFLTEWYVNRRSGLEQGFTLDAPPPGARAGARLRLEMTLSGQLIAEASSDSILFRDAGGKTKLRYAGLKVWDATGRELAAEMKLAENRLTLEVDDGRAVYPVTVDPTIVNESAKLLASDGAANVGFGVAVSVSGDTVVVGAHEQEDHGDNSGSAYVFEKPVGGWAGTLTQAAKLSPSDGARDDFFGFSISISGGTVVVGAFKDDDNGQQSGSAYIFEKPAGGWPGTLNENAKLLASDGAVDDRFGVHVSISGDTVVVASDADDDNGTDTGSAYVFEKPVGGWAGIVNESAKFLASDAAPSDRFGTSVGVSGSTVVVGVALDHVDGVIRTGSAYVFEEPVGGWAGTLTENAKLLASDRQRDDHFGTSVDISIDTVAVGSQSDDDQGSSSGSAYVFEKPVGGWAGTLNENAKLLASDGVAGTALGRVIAISGDTVVAQGGAFIASGSAYIFEKPASGWAGTLNESAKLLASDGAAGDLLGSSVGISGGTVVVGAMRDDDNGIDSGSAYVFDNPLGPGDADGDGVPDDEDICPGGDDNIDTDTDLVPDFCDACPLDDANDADGDGFCADVDTCPGGDDNINSDGEGLPDFCDVCPLDPENDADADGICESDDNCPIIANDNQADLDGDLLGDACDDDIDGDGVLNIEDNCIFDVNTDQSDIDGDGAGDVCDDDIDGDGVLDAADACVPSPVGTAVNTDGCAISELCPCAHPDGSDRWKNHGAYVSCVAHAANDFLAAGLITETEHGVIVSAAGSSTCGHKNR